MDSVVLRSVEFIIASDTACVLPVEGAMMYGYLGYNALYGIKVCFESSIEGLKID